MRRCKLLAAVSLIFSIPSFAGDVDLFTAASVGAIASVEEALSSDYNVNSADGFGNTALLLAAENGHLHVVRYLIKAGADINRQNIYGYTPLFSAVVNAHAEVIRELAANGADAALSNIYGTSAADYIAFIGYKDINSYIAAILSGGLQRRSGPNSFRYLAQNNYPLLDNLSDDIPRLSEKADAQTLYMAGKDLTDGVSPKNAELGNIYLQKAYALG
ncbi:MAG: ankyrin repeat domain-containing protein, partial [Deferribacteraceae bacterium]|nr:ankyrin repeat domain-containing protein [Deferribacteraceae bacterium]